MRALALGLMLLSGVEGGGGTTAEPVSVAWDGESTRLYSDATAAVRFAIPTANYLVQAHHLDRDTPAFVAKDDFMVLVGGEQALLIDVFHNPEKLSLKDFLDTHLKFLSAPAIAITEGRAGARQVPAILLDQPRSSQAFGQRIAVFALGDRVFKIACVNRDEPAFARLFERALASFEEIAR